MFEIDSRITNTSAHISRSSLSELFLKNNRHFLWFILVPRVNQVEEVYELNPQQRSLFIQEIADISKVVKEVSQAKKLNIGALGNIVPQLHLHIIARFVGDAAWPSGVWQPDMPDSPYDLNEFQRLVAEWSGRFA